MAKWNHFSNWETWVVSMHLDNLEELQDAVEKILEGFEPFHPDQVLCIQDLVKCCLDNQIILDVVDYDKIDWVELLNSKLKDLAYRNKRPGFMNITPIPIMQICLN